MNRIVIGDWYKNVYKDVSESGINPQAHYDNYGKSEKRFSNPLAFLNQFEKSPLIVNLIIATLFFSIPRVYNTKLASILFNFCVNLEIAKFRNYNFSEVCISSSLKDGVAEATLIYNRKFSEHKYFAVLRAIPHTNGADLQPMILEIWYKSKIVRKIPLIFSFFDLYFYNKRFAPIKNVYIQHIFQIETIVSYFLKNFNSSTIYFFIHDFYLFTNKYHLYDEGLERNYSLSYAFRNFPNQKIDLDYFVNRINIFICPSQFLFDKCKRYIPKQKLTWLYPPEEQGIEDLSVKKIIKQKIYTVLIIGNLGNYKGSQLILRVKNLIANEDLPYRFLHLGSNPVSPDDEFYTNISNLNRDDLLTLCKDLSISFAFLPFQADETYSFALSDIFTLRLPLITTQIGAVTERCLNRDLTLLMPRDISASSVVNLFKKLVNTQLELSLDKSKIPENIKVKRERMSDSYDFTFKISND